MASKPPYQWADGHQSAELSDWVKHSFLPEAREHAAEALRNGWLWDPFHLVDLDLLVGLFLPVRLFRLYLPWGLGGVRNVQDSSRGGFTPPNSRVICSSRIAPDSSPRERDASARPA